MFKIQSNKFLRSSLILAPLAILSATAAPAATLTNGNGDGQVNITVNGSGTFSAAYFNPKGPTETADTTFNSYAYFRAGSSGTRTALTNQPATTVSSSPTEMISTFSIGALSFTLTQTLSYLFNTSGQRIGSVLTQSYGFNNTGGSAVDFSMLRYFDGDMGFPGASRSGAGGGTALIDDKVQALFETMKVVGLDDETIFLGVTSEGGSPLGYEVDYYNSVNNHAGSGAALGNIVGKDVNGDGLADSGQDVGLIMESGFSIGAGQQGKWVTRTLFGSGSLGSVTFEQPVAGAVPEAGTWAMMILGFGLVGTAMRRRPTAISFA